MEQTKNVSYLGTETIVFSDEGLVLNNFYCKSKIVAKRKTTTIPSFSNVDTIIVTRGCGSHKT